MGLGDGFFKRVEIDDDQIDRLNAMAGRRGFMGRVAANEQQAAVDFWMQGLDSAIQHFWEAGKFTDFDDRQARVLECAGSAAGGDDFDAELMEFTDEFHQPCLV